MKKYDRPRWSDYKFPIAEAGIFLVVFFIGILLRPDTDRALPGLMYKVYVHKRYI